MTDSYRLHNKQWLRTKIIYSNEKDPVYVDYLRAWVKQVEMFGNLIYPEEARLKHLYGNTILAIEINADGSLKSVGVRRSSGHSVLDKAAVDAVKVAAPFDAFSDEMRSKYEVLVIVKTFQFVRGDQE